MNNRTAQGAWSFSAIMRDMGQAWRLFRDPTVPTIMKLLLPVAAVIYFLSPLDLMPGLPFDDIAILILALRLFVQFTEQIQPQPGNARSSTQTQDSRSGGNAAGPTIETSWHVVDE